MYNLSEQVAVSGDIKLAVATVYSGRQLKKIEVDGTLYYLLPCKSLIKYQMSLEPVWKEVCNEFRPDVVHIHGTEFAHGLACMRACPELKYVVSIQGLVSVIANYYYYGMSFLDILKNISFRDIIKMDSIFQAKRKFVNRGILEEEYIGLTGTITGQTDWDFAHTRYINGDANYVQYNRILRRSFYSADKWSILDKRSHSIFLSQARYPIKGLHQVLKAMKLLKDDFPDITVRVAGRDITQNKTIKDKIRLSGYGKYIRGLIKKFQLQEHIEFVGSLGQEDMIKEYLSSNVFICPSSIENESNSVAEAQILGVPCIASYVGGIPDMVSHGETGLFYRFEEIEMLAECIRSIFEDDQLALKLSNNGITVAEKRHNPKANLERTLEVYRIIRGK